MSSNSQVAALPSRKATLAEGGCGWGRTLVDIILRRCVLQQKSMSSGVNRADVSFLFQSPQLWEFQYERSVSHCPTPCPYTAEDSMGWGLLTHQVSVPSSLVSLGKPLVILKRFPTELYVREVGLSTHSHGLTSVHFTFSQFLYQERDEGDERKGEGRVSFNFGLFGWFK